MITSLILWSFLNSTAVASTHKKELEKLRQLIDCAKIDIKSKGVDSYKICAKQNLDNRLPRISAGQLMAWPLYGVRFQKSYPCSPKELSLSTLIIKPGKASFICFDFSMGKQNYQGMAAFTLGDDPKLFHLHY